MVGHPLFPADSDADAFECSWIAVAREERGSWVTAPEMFTADELQSLEQIQQRYGGGHYELCARHGGPSGRQLITRRVRVRLPGPSLALDGTSAPPETHAAQPMAGGFGAADPTTALLMQMMQQSEARAERNQAMMLQMFTSSQASTAQIMAAALANRGGDGGAAAVSQLATSMVTALTTMRAPKGGDGFKEGVEFAARFAGGGEEGAPGDDSSVIDSVAAIAAGVQAIGSMVPTGGAPSPGATVVPHAPPRSAAPASASPDPNRQPLPHAPGAGGGGRG